MKKFTINLDINDLMCIESALGHFAKIKSDEVKSEKSATMAAKIQEFVSSVNRTRAKVLEILKDKDLNYQTIEEKLEDAMDVVLKLAESVEESPICLQGLSDFARSLDNPKVLQYYENKYRRKGKTDVLFAAFPNERNLLNTTKQ